MSYRDDYEEKGADIPEEALEEMLEETEDEDEKEVEVPEEEEKEWE